MSLVRQRPRLHLQSHGPKQRRVQKLDRDLAPSGGCLTPEIQLTKPQFPTKPDSHCTVYKIGKYLLEHLDGETYKATDCTTGEEKICKVRIKIIKRCVTCKSVMLVKLSAFPKCRSLLHNEIHLPYSFINLFILSIYFIYCAQEMQHYSWLVCSLSLCLSPLSQQRDKTLC